MIVKSLQPHFIRWAKLEYSTPESDESGHATGLDVQLMLHEQGSLSFKELKEVIENRDVFWQESWEMYKKYNRI
ncbi:MAG: hypothetical protein KBA90_14345 [Chitinophagaceae bacterium]|nr:hypothetical protein [Chitinophagaceae bacterium]